jgi:hypothetical protein
MVDACVSSGSLAGPEGHRGERPSGSRLEACRVAARLYRRPADRSAGQAEALSVAQSDPISFPMRSPATPGPRPKRCWLRGDVEWAIDTGGKLWLLQASPGHRPAPLDEATEPFTGQRVLVEGGACAS